jgi:glycine hydroxymethyltransferase
MRRERHWQSESGYRRDRGATSNGWHSTPPRDALAIEALIDGHIAVNRAIHECDCVNLNPATNGHEPARRGSTFLGTRLVGVARLSRRQVRDGSGGDREDRGYVAELAAEVFGARYAETRVPSGAIANLYAFMATATPGDRIASARPRSSAGE